MFLIFHKVLFTHGVLCVCELVWRRHSGVIVVPCAIFELNPFHWFDGWCQRRKVIFFPAVYGGLIAFPFVFYFPSEIEKVLCEQRGLVDGVLAKQRLK